MAGYEFDPRPFGSHVSVLRLVGVNKRVLEVGCFSGYFSERLRDNGCAVVGIEIDARAAEMAKEYCENVIVGDLETMDSLPYPRASFDFILFADVLEHLKDPLRALVKLRSWLRDDGHIVCSIPNVAHIYVRLNLLLGRWDYEDIGLMDRTHLRFFTRSTARKLVEDAGFSIEEQEYSSWIPYFRIRTYRKLAGLGHALTRLFPGLLAFQFILKAKKA